MEAAAAKSSASGPVNLGQSNGGVPSGRLPKIPSLVFDIDLDDAEKAAAQHDELDTQVIVAELKRFLMPNCTAEFKLMNDVEDAFGHQQGEQQDLQNVAQRLSKLGYNCRIRHSMGGGEGFECLRNLRHSFLSVSLPGTSMATGQRYIVDASFREQFEIAKPTTRYTALLNVVPDVLVAPEDHVSPLVNFLCAELNLAFKANNAVLPPWRAASSMMSKWQPRQSMDQQVSAFSPGQSVGSLGVFMRKQQQPQPLQQQQLIGGGRKSMDAATTYRGFMAPAPPQNISVSQRPAAKPMMCEPMIVYGGFATVGSVL